MIAINPGQRWSYQIRADRLSSGETDPSNTVLQLRCLTPDELAEANDSLTVLQFRDGERIGAGGDTYEGAKIAFSKRNLRVLELGLTGWERMHDSEGKMVSFQAADRSRASKESIGRIPQVYWAEIATEILLRSQLTEKQKD